MKIRTLFQISLLWLCLLLVQLPLTFAQQSGHARSRAVKAPRPSRATAIAVGPNAQVSKAFADRPHAEIHLAANPRNPLNLVGGSMVWSQEKNIETVVAYASFDGGKTWSPTLKFDDGLYHSDPAAGFDAEGTAYFLQITNTGGREPKYYTHVYRSKDGGRSWLEPTIIPMLDRHYVVVDDGPGKYHGSLYIIGASSRAIRLRRSKDRGASFDGEALVAAAPTGRVTVGLAPPVVLSDGTLVVPFGDSEAVLDPDIEGSPSKHNAALKVATSTDGGAAFSEPVTIAPIAIGHALTANAHHFSFATDRSAGPFRDRLYVTWSDSYSGGSQFSKRKPRGANILLSYSADKGKSWSKPILLNDDHPPANWAEAPVHFQPVLAVNKTGVVGVMYYDRRDSIDNLDWTARFTASLDGGETFLPSVALAESPNRHGGPVKIVVSARGYGGGQRPLNASARGGALKFDINISQFNLAGGHTAGLAADPQGVFHPFWIDNRTGVAQIWTAPVTVNQHAVLHGDPELSALQDVSEKLLLKYSSPVYDSKTGRISVKVQLQNISDDTILLPVKMRVVILTSSGGGIPTILGADNGIDGVGAVWDLGSLIVDQNLKPGQRSEARQLEFHLTEMPPLNEATIRSRGWGALELLHVEARVLSNVRQDSTSDQK